MIVGILSDSFTTFQTKTDTTFNLSLKAHDLGYEIWQFEPDKIFAQGDQIFAEASKLTDLIDSQDNFYKVSRSKKIDLKNDIDVLLIRQDPPFDLQYISICLLLEKLTGHCLVINNPLAIRNCPEKLLPFLEFPEIMPKSEVVFNHNTLVSSVKNFNKVVIKPLFGNGGESVVVSSKEDKNLPSLAEMYFKLYPRQPVIVQEYLPDVKKGDKRVIIIDGEAIAALNRVPTSFDNRANLHVGAIGKVAELTDEDIKIVDAISQYLKKNDLFFVGIDIIGDKMTEINVTSPTGIREIYSQSKLDIAAIFWQKITKRIYE